jgi:hypothetical protein
MSLNWKIKQMIIIFFILHFSTKQKINLKEEQFSNQKEKINP